MVLTKSSINTMSHDGPDCGFPRFNSIQVQLLNNEIKKKYIDIDFVLYQMNRLDLLKYTGCSARFFLSLI